MKILLTGITGLLGSYLAKELSALGELHGLKRKGSTYELLGGLAENVIWHEGDINDYQSLEEIFEGMDLVVHSAGLVSYDPKDKEKLIKVNVEGTANVVNVMLQKGLKKLVYISSVAALGRIPGLSFIDEDTKWTASPLNSPYGISKYLGELEAWRGAQEGLDVMVFNPSVLLGRANDQRSSTAIYDYVLAENRFYPQGNINYIDVRDAAKMVVQLCQHAAWNERYILNKESVSYKAFFEQTATAFNKRPPHVPVSGWMLEAALLWMRANRVFRNSKPLLNSQTARLSQQSITFANRKATQAINFEYAPLKNTLDWASGNSI